MNYEGKNQRKGWSEGEERGVGMYAGEGYPVYLDKKDTEVGGDMVSIR